MPPRDAASTRARPTALLVAALILLGARIATGVRERYDPPRFPDRVQWMPATGAIAAARAQGKMVLYDFSATWCGPCQDLQREVFADPDAARLINDSFVAVRVDDDDDAPEATALKKKHGVDALPTLIAVEPDGDNPTTIEGYSDKERTVELLADALKKQASSCQGESSGRRAPGANAAGADSASP